MIEEDAPQETEYEIKVREAVNAITDLPTLSDVAIKVNQLMSDPSSSAADLARLISGDGAMSAKILRVVNSALYGMPAPVTSVNQAIVILGFRALRQLVLGISVYGAMPSGEGHKYFDPEMFWKHSLATAATARCLAKRLKLPGESETYFTAGMLHDIGMVVLVSNMPDFFNNAVAWISMVGEHEISFYEAERSAFASDHGFVASVLFEKWGLDQDLINVVKYYARPEEATGEGMTALLPKVIHVADILARCLLPVSLEGRKISPVSETAFAHLEAMGLDLDKLPELLEECHKEYSGAKIFMQL